MSRIKRANLPDIAVLFFDGRTKLSVNVSFKLVCRKQALNNTFLGFYSIKWKFNREINQERLFTGNLPEWNFENVKQLSYDSAFAADVVIGGIKHDKTLMLQRVTPSTGQFENFPELANVPLLRTCPAYSPEQS